MSKHPALLGALSTTAESVYNFSPGPTSLPKIVEQRIADSFRQPLTSLALSHRSPEFLAILEHALSQARAVMAIPEHYEILFTHAGGHGQFAAVPLNLCRDSDAVATYVVNGTWSARARDEAEKYCVVNTIDGSDPETKQLTYFPELCEDDIDTNSQYLYVCSNETVNGIELHRLPKLPASRAHIPLVVDASSDFATKPIDWIGSNIGVLFACASKNIGHPGVTMTVVRNDLLGKASPICPEVFNYKTFTDNGNLWNTPATFNIEVIGFVMDWLAENGGVTACETRSIAKAKMLYEVIDNSNGFYQTPIKNTAIRSRMNVPFNVASGNEALTEKFLIDAWERGIVGLRTLTPFGFGDYLRASLYNGISESDTKVLADFMNEFATAHS